MSRFGTDRQSALVQAMDHFHGVSATLHLPDDSTESIIVRVLSDSGQWSAGGTGEAAAHTLEVEISECDMATPTRGYALTLNGRKFSFDDTVEARVHGKHFCRFRRVVPSEVTGRGYRGGPR